MSRAPANVSHAASAQQDRVGEFRLGGGKAEGNWWDYVHGAVRGVPGAARQLPGVLVAVDSEVPVAAGLSSSAALCVASATAAATLCGTGQQWPCAEVAHWAHHAEADFVGMPCGIMDQMSSSCARAGLALRLWCDSLETQHIPFDRGILIIDSATPRALRRSEYTTRKAECDEAFAAVRRHFPDVRSLARLTEEQLSALELPDTLMRRARHVVTEVSRVEVIAQRLMDAAPIGDVLLASHASLRDEYECSTRELDWIVDRAVATPGVEGARLTGAGWGGCAIAAGTAKGLAELAEVVRTEFSPRWSREASVWRTAAGAGARVDFVHESVAGPLGLSDRRSSF
jgi:galactokinase